MLNSGDTAWMLVSCALVMLMTPGLGLFYGGMVQRKNVLSTLMHSFFALALISIQWALIGYTLAFGPSKGGFIGGFDFAFLNDVGMDAAGGRTIPHLVWMMYQGMFAIITPALISGAYAERMKFTAYIAFTLLWATLVYDPLAHWVWNPDGWLAKLGALDYAGGTVVHLSSGISALVCAIVLGKRVGYPEKRHAPHNLTMTIVGAGLLWFGWFGFNAGSAVKADGFAATALVNTHMAAAAGAFAWALVEQLRLGKMTMLGVASGLVAGLVVITPAAGFVSPMSAIALGLCAGFICYGGVMLKSKFGYDDSLDAFGVHGVGGAAGAILTGIFAAKALTPDNAGGLITAGNAKIVGIQALAVGVTAVFAVVMTVIILKVIDAVIGLRVSKDDEREGLDIVLHGESGYEDEPATAAPIVSEREAEAPAKPVLAPAQATNA
jgi:Amt family ammonium transporter